MNNKILKMENRAKRKRSDYTFLSRSDSWDWNPKEVFVIPSEKIETLRISETYDTNGQKLGASDCGDSIQLDTELAVSIANKVFEDNDEDAKFEIYDVIYAYDNSTLFYLLEAALKENAEDVDYTLYAEEAEGFDYWDGSNWKTILLEESDLINPQFEIIDDEDDIKEYTEAIENMKYDSEGFGKKIYRYKDYEIEDNYCEGHWELYIIKH